MYQKNGSNGAHEPIVTKVKSEKSTKKSPEKPSSKKTELKKSPPKREKAPESPKKKVEVKVENGQSSSQYRPEVKPEAPVPPSLLWVEKYKPTNLKSIIGQQGDKSNMRKLMNWVQNWNKIHGTPGAKAPPRPPPWNAGADNGAWAKAALLSGPPGNYFHISINLQKLIN